MNKRTARRIARFVRNARMEMELSQQEFASKLRVSRGFLSDIERAARSISVDTLQDIARVTKATTDQVLGRKSKLISVSAL